MNTSTIAIISTPPINSAISIIRITGDEAYKIISKLCKKNIVKKGYTFSKEYIYDKDEILDEVIILKFVKPRSFTGEDLIEINCHGGILITNKIFELVLKNGARKAENGEFTKRAFLNNKISIRQANSINNLIFAKTESCLKLSSNGIINKNSEYFERLKEELFSLIGKIEVNIDYPEYDDVEEVAINQYYELVNKVIKELTKIKEDFKKISYLYKGINISIIGKPNVGKSSLLNAILQKDRAIVSNVKGTTRDIISESIVVNGLLLNFIDTAGIRNSKNTIESIGIQKSLKTIDESDLILFVIDSSKKIDKYEKKILEKISNKKFIFVKNKSDLNIDANPNFDGVKISSKNKDIKKLIHEINNSFCSSDFNIAKNLSICSEDELQIVNECLNVLKRSLKNKKNNFTIDVLVEDIKIVYKHIATLLGNPEDLNLIDKMFQKFCLGK